MENEDEGTKDIALAALTIDMSDAIHEGRVVGSSCAVALSCANRKLPQLRREGTRKEKR
jgi:hypothetical protein